MSIKLQSNPFDYRETGEIGEYDYTAAEERARMRGIAKDGFGRGYPDPGRIAPGGGNQVAVSPFDAFVNGLHVLSPISVTVELEPAGEQERIDLIVVRANNTQEIGAAYLDTITGVAGGGVPSPTYNEDVWETPIAKIVRPANSLAITAADITEIRAFAMDADTVDGMHGTEFLTRTGQIITSTMHADLNDYTEPGDYYCEANVTAATITNCPHPWAFYLEVRRIGNMVIQRWTSYDVGMVCMRYKSGDSWWNWRDDPLPYSGTWTPTFYVGETAQATTNASGKWWRLGPLVWVSFGATMANAPTVSSGELSIRGLPIAAVGQAGLACGNYNVPALDQEIVLLAVDGSKIRPLTYNVTGSYAGNSSALYGGKLAEGVTIRYASGCYLTE